VLETLDGPQIVLYTEIEVTIVLENKTRQEKTGEESTKRSKKERCVSLSDISRVSLVPEWTKGCHYRCGEIRFIIQCGPEAEILGS
jgi:hypothetical protein